MSVVVGIVLWDKEPPSQVGVGRFVESENLVVSKEVQNGEVCVRIPVKA